MKLRTLKTYKPSNPDDSEIVELGALHREQITHKDLLEIKQSFPNCKIVVTYKETTGTYRGQAFWGNYIRHFVSKNPACIGEEMIEITNACQLHQVSNPVVDILDDISMNDVIRIDVYPAHKFD